MSASKVRRWKADQEFHVLREMWEGARSFEEVKTPPSPPPPSRGSKSMFLRNKPQQAPHSPPHSFMSPGGSLKVLKQRLRAGRLQNLRAAPASPPTGARSPPSFVVSCLLSQQRPWTWGGSQHLLSLAVGSVSFPQSGWVFHLTGSFCPQLGAPSAFGTLATPPLGSQGSR